MRDPASDDPPASPDLADSDSRLKIERLLMAGLDHYFQGRYEHAIEIWTRVLFLERGHDRARAYIERARAAMAERQRAADELVESGMDAFARGDSQEARSLLRSAIAQGSGRDEALSVLDRLDRLEAAAGPETDDRQAAPQPASSTATAPVGHSPRRLRVAPLVVLGAALVAMTYLATSGIDRVARAPAIAAPSAPWPLPVPDPSELDLARARRLEAAGRRHEALAVLDLIAAGDALAGEADRMRARIQRALLEPRAAADAEP